MKGLSVIDEDSYYEDFQELKEYGSSKKTVIDISKIGKKVPIALKEALAKKVEAKSAAVRTAILEMRL